MLKECDVALSQAYDVAMLDLDGVVYVGSAAVPGAREQLAKAADAGMRLAYVTNNASRSPATVAEHLVRLGIAVNAEDVVTSAQAASRLLADQLPSGSPVFVIGGTGLFEALAERGLTGVQEIDAQPVAVVSGYHPDLRWKTVIDGAILVKRGLPWVATNTDLTVPTDQGQGPGNGVLVKVVADFAGREPVVAGKPAPPLFEETRDRVGGRCPLVVGDRLDTDIEGAVNAGFDSLLVMTGVTGLDELVRAEPAARPTYVAAGLDGLATPHDVPESSDGACRLNGWSASVEDGVLDVVGEGTADDWWRVVATAAWTHLDETSNSVSTDGLRPPVGPGR